MKSSSQLFILKIKTKGNVKNVYGNFIYTKRSYSVGLLRTENDISYKLRCSLFRGVVHVNFTGTHTQLFSIEQSKRRY